VGFEHLRVSLTRDKAPGNRVTFQLRDVLVACHADKSFGEIVDECELSVSDAYNFTWNQRMVTADRLPSHRRSIAAVQIANGPLAAGMEDLCVTATGSFVLNDDLIRRRSSNRDRATRSQPEHICPARAFTDY
jgi:hypothetical protein